MVHYIRFLRVPQCAVSRKKTVDISAVVAVQTDLGDALLNQDVLFVADIVEANSPHGVLHSQSVLWQPAIRALKLTVQCPCKYLSRPVRVHVTAKETASALKLLEVPRILDVWSSELYLSDKQRSEPVVERRVPLPNNTSVRMWEETGESIARHIW